MQHKNTQTSSLLAIKKYVKSLPKCLAQRSDLELVDVINAQNQQSEPAKTIIIYRYLPKVLKSLKKYLMVKQETIGTKMKLFKPVLKLFFMQLGTLTIKKKRIKKHLHFLPT